MSVYATQGGISIYATRAEEIAIYRTDGTMVTCGVTEAEMPSDGIFIVRSAGENVKVLVE